MGAPLIWFAIERLEPKWRWLVYIALVVAVVLPLGLRHETWVTALINGLTGSVYVLFLAMFVNMRLKEQQAREHAERLTVV